MNEQKDIVDTLEALATSKSRDNYPWKAQEIQDALLNAAMEIRWLRAEMDDAGLRWRGSAQ